MPLNAEIDIGKALSLPSIRTDVIKTLLTCQENFIDLSNKFIGCFFGRYALFRI